MSDAHTESQAPIRAYLTYYIDGELASAWQNFPTTSEEMEYNLGRSGIEAEHLVGILDTLYETSVRGLDTRLPRKPDLNELNELAHRLAGMDDIELDTFAAALEAGGNWDTVADLINVAQNLDQFDFYPGAFSKQEFGGIMFEMHGEQYREVLSWLRDSDDPENRDFAKYVKQLESSVDLVKYATLAQKYDGGALTSTGYLVPMGTSLPQKYTGLGDIPPEHLLTGQHEAPQQKPSLLGAVAAVREKQAAEAPERERGHDAPTGPEL